MWKKQLKKGLVIGKFELIKQLGEGTTGVVFKAKNLETKEEVALKIGDTAGTLYNEAHTRRKIGDVEGLYTIIDSEKADPNLGIKYFSMPLYEKTLKDFYESNTELFTPKYIYKLISKIIVTLYDIHEAGYVFRDLSLNNLMNLGKKWYLIDAGASLPLSFKLKTGFTGTPAFSSINALKGGYHNIKDDLESLGYIMLYLFNGTLPWLENQPTKKATAKYYTELGDSRKEQTLALIKKLDNKKLKKFFKLIYKEDDQNSNIYQDLIDILKEKEE